MRDQAKQVVFRYNDDDTDADVEVDILGRSPAIRRRRYCDTQGKVLEGCSGSESPGPHRLAAGSSLYRNRH